MGGSGPAGSTNKRPESLRPPGWPVIGGLFGLSWLGQRRGRRSQQCCCCCCRLVVEVLMAAELVELNLLPILHCFRHHLQVLLRCSHTYLQRCRCYDHYKHYKPWHQLLPTQLIGWLQQTQSQKESGASLAAVVSRWRRHHRHWVWCKQCKPRRGHRRSDRWEPLRAWAQGT